MESSETALDGLGARRAWTRSRGSADVRVAVVAQRIPARSPILDLAPLSQLCSVPYSQLPSAQAPDLGGAIEQAVEAGACIIHLDDAPDLERSRIERAIQYAGSQDVLVICPAAAPPTRGFAPNLLRAMAVDDSGLPLADYPPGAADIAVQGVPPERAAPHVSGCAALLKALNQSWGFHELREHLMVSAATRPELDSHCPGGLVLHVERAVVGPLEIVIDADAFTWSALNDGELQWRLHYRSALCVNTVALYRPHGDDHWRELGFARAGALRMRVPASALRRSAGTLRLASRESNFHADDVTLVIR